MQYIYTRHIYISLDKLSGILRYIYKFYVNSCKSTKNLLNKNKCIYKSKHKYYVQRGDDTTDTDPGKFIFRTS